MSIRNKNNCFTLTVAGWEVVENMVKEVLGVERLSLLETTRGQITIVSLEI